MAAARAAGVPVVFFQEVHRPNGVDFGRELDGTEGVHCVEGQPGTDLGPSLRPLLEGEFHIVKRRYSGFIGTDFEIVLRGLRASTLVLIGGLTDVCVHYTFADAHQRDFYVRVVTDCVGGSSSTCTMRHWPRWSTCRPARSAAPKRSSPHLMNGAAFAAPLNNSTNPFRRSRTMSKRLLAIAAAGAATS